MSADEILQGFEPDKVITNDGSAGKKGSILDYLDTLVNDYKPEIIYACGPSVVLKAISKLGVPSQLALDKVMACGIGVCKGCVIKIKKGDTVQNMTICHDGPVFAGEEIIWE
jgi:dihydroorotate dehydrogenase electron transfer subunit